MHVCLIPPPSRASNFNFFIVGVRGDVLISYYSQYCRVNQNWTLSGFTECATFAAQDHNLTLGITGCEAGAGRMGKMALEGAVLGAAFVGLVLAF